LNGGEIDMGATAVRDVAAMRLEALELMDAYVECLDDDRLEEWPDFFVENAVYKIMARENVERGLPIATMSCTSKGMMQDRVVALRKASVFSPRYLRHLVSNLRVLGMDGDAYLLQANFAVFQTLMDEESKVFMVGKYRAKLLLTGDGPKFREVLAIYDSLQIPGLLAVPI
jgi:anthranilate 1,2-dioxygenase small subunit